LQRKKLNLQEYQSKQQSKVGMGGRDMANTGSRRRRNNDLDTKDKILVQLVSSFCKYNIEKCIHLGACCVDNY
jgi:hypothetical protein